MDRTPPPVSLTAALALPRTPGRSTEVFVDSELEVRFAATDERPAGSAPAESQQRTVLALGFDGAASSYVV
jgi:hypothetical protein